MTIESSKDSSKGDNKSNESKCSVNECASYAHKLIKFNDESNGSNCAIDANAHTLHNPTGNFIPRSTSMNMIQVKDSTFATQDKFTNSMSQHTTRVEYEAQVRNTLNVQRSFVHHHTSKTFSVNSERSPPLTRLSGSYGQFFPSYGERCQHQSIPHVWSYASYGNKKEEIYLLHSPSKDSPSDILSKFWSHQTPYDLIKPFIEMKVLLLITLTHVM